MTLGEKMAALRKELGLTQQQFAEKIGVHPQHITRLESDRSKPSNATLTRIHEVFGVRLEDFFNNHVIVSDVITQDKQLVEKMQQVRELDPEDRAMVYRMIDTLATQKRMALLMKGQKVTA